jgi:hypothetical protein
LGRAIVPNAIWYGQRYKTFLPNVEPHNFTQSFEDNMDYLRTIKLGFGMGKPGKQACWMTALQAHLGREWTDKCDCVDPIINKLCITINDIYDSDNTGRTEDILEFGLFAPLGTKGTVEDSQRRMFKLVDVAVRVWTPYRLRLRNKEKLAIKIEQLSPIVDKKTAASIMRDVADDAAAYVANAVDYAIAAVDAPNANAAADYAAAAAYSVTNVVASAAAYVANTAVKRQFLKEHVYPVLRELIEMGPHAPKEPDLPVCGVQKFQELVGIV